MQDTRQAIPTAEEQTTHIMLQQRCVEKDTKLPKPIAHKAR